MREENRRRSTKRNGRGLSRRSFHRIAYYDVNYDGNGHPRDHYVEFAQVADQLMVWVGLTREALSWAHILLKGISTAGSIYEFTLSCFSTRFSST